MVKHKLIAIGILLLIPSTNYTAAAGLFEDADQSNDFLSTSISTHSHFDLRHTIPGEPGVDYPILSAVPSTGFECAGRHEGYYADTETRCQVFRICTYTARGKQGFGFLCPNGTLFSQKNFVCDWYRNVDCNESERYYSKNSANRIGSKQDMMETVRQMMEYPMKTISKALQRQTGASKQPTNALSVGVAEASTKNETSHVYGGRKNAVTRAQVESAYKYGNAKQDETKHAERTHTQTQVHTRVSTLTPSKSLLTSAVEETASNNLIKHEHEQASTLGTAALPQDDVYVNSLGELSSDPGVHFIKSQSHIIAEAPPSEKKLNFAQTINTALNDLDDLSPASVAFAPDYVKRMRSTLEGSAVDLASNVNDLLRELENEQDTSVAGYQVRPPNKKHSIALLSRGFYAQGDEKTVNKTSSYVYNKPKQTSSTINFTQNELSSDSHKSFAYDDVHSELHRAINTLQVSDEAVQFMLLTTSTTPKTISANESHLATTFNIASLDYGAYLSPPILEALDYGAYLSPPILEAPDQNDVELFAPIRVINESGELGENLAGSLQNKAALGLESATATQVTATSTELTLAESKVALPAELQPLQSIVSSRNDELDAEIDEKELELLEEKKTVNKHAADLFLAGVKLSILDAQINNNKLPAEIDINTNITSIGREYQINAIESTVNIPKTSTTTTTTTEALPAINVTTSTPATIITTTSAMSTSTETVTEVSSVEHRVRNYRRFATIQRASIKPQIVHTKRNYIRTAPKTIRKTTNKTTTTTKVPQTTTKMPQTTTTRNYQKRVAASRLRLSKLTTVRSNTTSSSRVSYTSRAVPTNRTPTRATTPLIPATTTRSMHNSERETATDGYNPDASSNSSRPTVATWESVRNNLQRYQVNRSGDNKNAYTTTVSPAPITHLTTTRAARTKVSTTRNSSLPRSRNRFSSFSSQQTAQHSATAKTTTVITSTTAAPTTTSGTFQTQQQQNLRTLALPTSSISNSYARSSLTSNADHNFLNSLTSANADLSLINSISSTSNTDPSFIYTIPSSLSLQSLSSVPNPSISIDTNSVQPNLASSTFDSLTFNTLTKSIDDDSILQNFRSSQLVTARPSTYDATTTVRSSGYGGSSVQDTVRPDVNHFVAAHAYTKIAAQAPSELTPPIRPQHIPLRTDITTAQTPSIVVARAEGQRIEPNSLHSIIANLAKPQQLPQKKTSQQVPYVPLDDFLTTKFGKNNIQTANNRAIYQHQQQQLKQSQQQQYQVNRNYQQQQTHQFPQQQPLQQQINYYQQPSNQVQQQPSAYLTKQQYQQPQQQLLQQSQQQVRQQSQPQQHPFGQLVHSNYQTQVQHPFSNQNIFANYQQLPQLQYQPQQLQQQPQASFNTVNSNNLYRQPIDSVNVPLPALPNGLLPSLNAQRRSDEAAEILDLSANTKRSSSVYDGASSYDVPINSIGRLANDKQQRWRQRRY